MIEIRFQRDNLLTMKKSIQVLISQIRKKKK